MSARWVAQKERGTLWMMKIVIWIARHLGRSFTRLLLYPIVSYFLLTGRAARLASMSFLRQAMAREPGWIDSVRHFHAYAAVELDRVYLLCGETHAIDIEWQHREIADELAQRGQGYLLLVAHFGSFEVLRVIGTMETDRPIRILMDRRHGGMSTQVLEALNPQLAAGVIDVSQRGPDLVLRLKDALDQGQVVGMMADRIYEDENSVRVRLFGRLARLPASPWLLASILQVPVVLGFGVYHGGNRYVCRFELLTERIVLAKAERQASLQGWAQTYADRLEHHVRAAPYNWFNFYPYWVDEPA